MHGASARSATAKATAKSRELALFGVLRVLRSALRARRFTEVSWNFTVFAPSSLLLCSYFRRASMPSSAAKLEQVGRGFLSFLTLLRAGRCCQK